MRYFSTAPTGAANLPSEAKNVLVVAKPKDNTQVAKVKNLHMIVRHLRELLNDIEILQAGNTNFKRIKSKINGIERLIAVEKASDLTLDSAYSGAKESALKSETLEPQVNDVPRSKRALWRMRKKMAARSAETKTDTANDLQETKDQQQLEIVELESILETYKKYLEAAEKAYKEQTEKLADVRRRKKETLAKKRALLKQLRNQVDSTQQAKKARQLLERKERTASYDSFSLGNILDEAVSKDQELFEDLDGDHLPVSHMDGYQAQHVAEEKISWDELRGHREVHGELQGEKAKEQPLNNSVSSQSSSIPSTYDDTESLSTSQRTPSANLRLHVPTSGLVPVDSNFTANFEAPIHSLQSQISEMQDRLKTSFPRIDNLPYDVSKSQNKRTLQTWLKILVSRWQTRLEDIDKTRDQRTEASVTEKHVRKVLDEMVREHDLSNEAAERMATRWCSIFEQRNRPTKVAEDVFDWDEFHAGGMDFLKDGQDAQANENGRTVEPKTLFNRQSKRTHIASQAPSYEPATQRLYSTSSRPPLDPELSPKATSEDSKTSPAPPNLPHLTATGSAHMVSVSQKAHTGRTAIAVGTVYFSNPTPLSLIRSNSLKKGDVLSVSRIAGIMAAKKCPDLIPLCHPIALTHVGVELKVFGPDQHDKNSNSSTVPSSGDMGHGGILIEAKVQCTGQTGVEMEALTAIMGATLSVVDMCKAVDKFQRVQDVRVVLKEGGKSGTWKEEGWRSFQSEDQHHF